jgi:type II secretory pathway pseudopilin PulG
MRRSGFTLLEVMLFILLAGVLAAVAMPLYSDYRRNVRSETAQAYIGAIRAAQLAYYENEQLGAGSFANDLKALDWALPGGGTIGKGPARYEYGTITGSSSTFGFQNWAFAVVRDERRSSKVKYNLIEIDLSSGAVGASP